MKQDRRSLFPHLLAWLQRRTLEMKSRTMQSRRLRVMNDRFPVTTEIMGEFDGWVRRLSESLLPAQLVLAENGLRWTFTESSPPVLLVAKAVRMTSGFRAAWQLLVTGYVTESACILRVVADLSLEAFAVAEGELRGKPTKAQQEFVNQFFERKPLTPEDALNQEKRRYVSREELIKAHVRLSDEAGIGGERTRALIRSLNHIYDGYVHGAYTTAMELYHPLRHDFMLHGHESLERRLVFATAAAGMLHQVLEVLRLSALVTGDRALHHDIGQALARLEAADEQSLRRSPHEQSFDPQLGA